MKSSNSFQCSKCGVKMNRHGICNPCVRTRDPYPLSIDDGPDIASTAMDSSMRDFGFTADSDFDRAGGDW